MNYAIKPNPNPSHRSFNNKNLSQNRHRFEPVSAPKLNPNLNTSPLRTNSAKFDKNKFEPAKLSFANQNTNSNPNGLNNPDLNNDDLGRVEPVNLTKLEYKAEYKPYNPYKNPKKTKTLLSRFSLKHVFRAGGIVWTKHKGKDFYLVFKSHSRPNRGIQLPGGRIERLENPAQAILREVHEETGIVTKIVCPLGWVFFEKLEDNYSCMQLFYILRPLEKVDVFKSWRFIDEDQNHQEVECWFTAIDEPSDFLVNDHSEVVEMFRQWLKEHKKDESEFGGY